ncbi:putative membrane protein [Rheinheimera pacifica]|uniref:Uncharacterized protein n=1 Tax=Arsukibacterium ikkense TaxID=336831 RepID=A0A0M2UZP5_9GAMM|nr:MULTISPECIES: hypothetical protein [Chromatiaceae]KKO43801.1 hypothetical protein WG68_18850 [Arsukibacterium ikkense]MDR6982552.1 putative membrane protein [Rheinheimera pacifica]
MESWISSGLIGGLVAVVIGVIFTNAARGKATNGELKHGLLILILALACLAFSLFAVWAFFYDEDVHEKTSEFVAVLGLFFGFGIAAIACFAEYFKVKGRFDSRGIEFHTPWTGTKKENWDDLVSAKFNASMYWYTLKFKSGKKVRLSSYLHGHGEVLAILKERGYDF